MTNFDDRERAAEPQDLGALFLERTNAGDVDGAAALYEPDAVVAAGGELANTSGNLARTSTRLPRRATAEIARRQSDGTWLWVADQPNLTQLRSTTAAA